MSDYEGRPACAAADPASKEAYERQGFAVARSLLGFKETDRIRAAIDGLFERIESIPPGHVYDLDSDHARGGPAGVPAIRNILKLAPHLAGEMEKAVLSAGRRYLGRTLAILWEAAVYMPPGRPEVESAWHQDAYVYKLSSKREPKAFGYFWLALDDVDASGGAIRFVPGSHLGPLLPHGWRRGDPKSGMEVSAPIDLRSIYTASLRAGDATFHHPRMLHGAGPNTSDRCRKAWVIGVGTPRLPPWIHHARNKFKRRTSVKI